MSGFGKAKYEREGGSGFKRRQTLKVGSNIRRILPPFGSLADRGEWKFFGAQHFGYFIENPKDADKPIPKPFKCVLKKKKVNGEYMVVQECAECQILSDKKLELEQITADLKREGASKEQFLAQTEMHTEWLKNHNLDKKWYMNTMLEDGTVELTAISNTCYWRLDELFKKLRNDEKVDPTDPNEGVWVDFVRSLPNNSKNLRDADDVPHIVYETVNENGRRMKVMKSAPLTESQIEFALGECTDLGKMFLEISPEQIKQLVECSGEPIEVSTIMGLPQKHDSPPRGELKAPKEPESDRRPQGRAPSPQPKEASYDRVPAPRVPAPAAAKGKSPSELVKSKEFASSLFGSDDEDGSYTPGDDDIPF